jgi:hypothetical protein
MTSPRGVIANPATPDQGKSTAWTMTATWKGGGIRVDGQVGSGYRGSHHGNLESRYRHCRV